MKLTFKGQFENGQTFTYGTAVNIDIVHTIVDILEVCDHKRSGNFKMLQTIVNEAKCKDIKITLGNEYNVTKPFVNAKLVKDIDVPRGLSSGVEPVVIDAARD